jgi:hypothetical protein
VHRGAMTKRIAAAIVRGSIAITDMRMQSDDDASSRDVAAINVDVR